MKVPLNTDHIVRTMGQVAHHPLPDVLKAVDRQFERFSHIQAS